MSTPHIFTYNAEVSMRRGPISAYFPSSVQRPGENWRRCRVRIQIEEIDHG